MKTPTVLRVIAVLIAPVALVCPIFASSVIQPWLKRLLFENYDADAARFSLGATGLILLIAPFALIVLALSTPESEERMSK